MPPDTELQRDVGDLERLRELASMIAASAPGFAVYEGGSTGRWLFTEPGDPSDPLKPGGSGQIAYMAPGQRFDVHAHHGSTEVLVVVNGVLSVAAEGHPHAMRLSPGDSVRLVPGERHNACAVTEVVVVGITVPRDGGYPSGPDTCIQPGPAE